MENYMRGGSRVPAFVSAVGTVLIGTFLVLIIIGVFRIECMIATLLLCIIRANRGLSSFRWEWNIHLIIPRSSTGVDPRVP